MQLGSLGARKHESATGPGVSAGLLCAWEVFAHLLLHSVGTSALVLVGMDVDRCTGNDNDAKELGVW